MALGVDESFLRNKHGPCPICGGKDRYRFDDKDGDGTYFCNAHGAGDGFSLLMEVNGWDFIQAAKEVRSMVDTVPIAPQKPQRTPEQLRAELNRLYKECKKATEKDQVGIYLKNRGIIVMPDVLYHASLPYYELDTATGQHTLLGKYPAMIALARNQDGKPVALHRTYLSGGKKAAVPQPKKMMRGGDPLTGCLYVRLFQALPVMGIAEGIETACAASQMFGLPVWSVLNASYMEHFVPPSGVTTLRIFSDNDTTYTGQKSAYTLANKLALKGMTVTVEVPPMPDMDWLDMLNMPETQNVVNLFKDFNPKLNYTNEGGRLFGAPTAGGFIK